MDRTAIPPLSALTPQSPARWQRAPLLFEHRLHTDPGFDKAAIADLIGRYPRQNYSIVHMGEQGANGKRVWREGEFGGLDGHRVLDAIEHGRLWLNLRDGHDIDPSLRAAMMSLFAEAGALAPPVSSYDHRMGILVSSPNAQVYYHADLPGQGLLQLHGRKRIYLYPPRPPFLSPEGLENIALSQLEVGLRYEPDFDQGAQVFDLEAGQGLFWPLNSPHRIENHDCLNISMTLEYWTQEIRRSHMINMANGILRRYFHHTPRNRRLSGPSFYAKAALQSLWRRSGRLNALRRAARPVDFRLDPEYPGRIVDLDGNLPA
ncbi:MULTISPECIES: hypothetical protein [unclassified Lysobacter]|uniref:hypothetical protein n=1 Tax=unclassified Lysobacter TaxID=2635362 RepID=UPI001BE9EFDF|nr:MULTISPECIES: hypothetical protein [unclassified Lysobacter]MBT2748641.1 hypothetical protein [Lysobacter sp. ISL-42]MBT2751576.1 hypothetical protein [Lysobacter sp. ISL-50]MBT2775770.1 hypothetical protein [Lysobacter sp. ISL-54]MBT2782265.1 hypothetical protein [Lysobacter sp. ISL-52]